MHQLDKDGLVNAFRDRARNEAARVGGALSPDIVADYISQSYDSYSQAVNSGGHAWKSDVPGKPIFNALCGQSRMQTGRLKNLYLQSVEDLSASTFQDIVDIFQDFSNRATPHLAHEV